MKPPTPDALRAAKLSHVPGVTIAEAAARFAVGAAAIRRARNDPSTRPSLAELAFAALTRNGTARRGALGLARIAGWIDYLNHDGCTEADARTLLAECVAAGLLALDGDRWRRLADWP